MKQIKLIYALLLAVMLPLLTACYNDDATTVDDPTQQDGKIKVHLRVSQAAPTTTRAWVDKDNATNDEMMNVWTVVAVNNADNKVEGIWSCKPSGEPDREIDEIDAELSREGNYRFYSFANMSPQKVMELLRITSSTTTTDSEKVLASAFSSSVGNNTVVEIAFDDGATVAPNYNIAVNVKGNDFDPASTEDNGFDATGIPMSNVQTFDLKEGDRKDLIVIRMLAKIKLQIYNDSGSDITINSVTLTSLTANTKEGDADYKNLMLLPKLSTGQDTMESSGQYHGDIEPNLNETPEQEEYIYYTSPSDKKIDKENNTLASGTPVEYVFYVNESENPKGENWGVNGGTAQEFNRYFLIIDIDGEKQQRYTLIDDSNADKGSDKWDYIARNDYRIIPIVLDDYKLDLIPYDFPAIGVYPASVKEEDGIYTINFHDYGHFHLLPQVTRYSSPTTVVPYDEESSTVGYWTLYEDDFDKAWGTWTDASKTPYTGNFYRTTVTGSADGDEAGGVPVWYENTSNPKWRPNATIGYQPFIFGYIADPGNKLSEDKKVYHEFSIYLYKEGMNTPRMMTYRLYMILDESQMMYPNSSRRHGVSAVRHTHGY